MSTHSYYKAASWWHKWRDAKLVDEFHAGASVAEIAEKWQYHRDTVTKILRYCGVKI